MGGKEIKNIIQLFILIILALGVFSFSQNSNAAIRKEFNYQGKLTDSNGLAVADGAYDITFRIYDQAGGGSVLWTEEWKAAALFTDSGTTIADNGCAAGVDGIGYTSETNESSLVAGQTLWNTNKKQSAIIESVDIASNRICVYAPAGTWESGDEITNRIYVKNGLFSVMVGAITPQSVNFSGSNYYLGVTVGTDAEMIPRKKIGSVPQAWNANNLSGDGIIDIDNTSVSQDAASINYNPISGSYSALNVIYGSGGGTGSALTVTQNGAGDIVDFQSSGISVFSIAANGDITTTGNFSSPSINDTLYVDGNKYAKDETGIQNAIDDLPATGGKVVLPAGTYNLTPDLDAAIAYASGVYTNETTEANNDTASDMTLLSSSPQINDAYYFGFDQRSRLLFVQAGTAGVGTWTISWEYWNGSTWTPLLGVTDGTAGFTLSGNLYYTLPTDWEKTTVDSLEEYYIRARVSSFTSMTTQPLGTQSYLRNVISINKSHVSLVGEGDSTSIRYTGTKYIGSMINAESSVVDVSISNMALTGSDAGGYSGINFSGVSYSEIKNVNFYDCSSAIFFITSSYNTIAENTIQSSNSEGMVIGYGSSLNIISNNHISGSGEEGVGLWGNYGPTSNGYDNIIENNILEGNQNGIWMGRWAPRTVIRGNIIRNNTSNGIHFRVSNPYDTENLRGTTIAENKIYANAGSGIYLEGWGSPYDHINIENNVINENAMNGIEIGGGRYLTIKNNHLFNNSQAAHNTYSEIIFDAGSSGECGYNTIEGNVITESATNKAKYGIRESSTVSDYSYYANNQVSGAATTNVSTSGTHDTIYNNNSITLSNGEKIDNATDGRISITGDLSPATNTGYDLGTITMDTTADVTVTGATSEGLGYSVRGAGDVNGDGYADVVAGAIWGSKAYVFLGGSAMDTIADVTMTGSGSNRLGSAVASAGDVNGDGYADVIVGANDDSTLNPYAGSAHIFFGGATMDNVADFSYFGQVESGDLGSSVASAGDVNGDGYADIIVGEPGNNTVYIFFGGSAMDNIPDITLNGEASGDEFGESISSAGDVNGDGYPDIIVGAYDSNSTGRAYIYYGGPTMDTIADVIFNGETASDWFGGNVASAGDVNGDGYNDIVIGAHNYGTTDSGRAYVYYGGSAMNNIADVTMTGTSAYSLGSSVASAGDVNGDGYADVIVGAIWGYRAYVYYGGTAMNNVADVTFTGTNGAGFGGFDSVANIGDTNGDGYGDLVVGSPYYSSNTGRIYVYRGSGMRWESVFAQNINASKGLTIGNLAMNMWGINTASQFGIYSSNWSVNNVGIASFQDLSVGGNIKAIQNGTTAALSVTQNGTGDIVDIKDGATSVFKISDGGDIIMTGNLTTPSINNILYVDGTTYAQNSTGIQAAIDALPAEGGKVILPAGTYNVTATINIIKSNVVLEGAGEATLLSLQAGVDVIVVGDGTNSYSGINISNFKIDGNRASLVASDGIVFNQKISNSRIADMRILNCEEWPIWIYGAAGTENSNIIIENNIISGSYWGIQLARTSKSTVSNNQITGGYDGIWLESYSNNVTVIGNTISNCNRNGIAVMSNYDTITSNTISGNGGSGIYVYGSTGNAISSNTIYNNASTGISFNWSTTNYNNVIGNNIYNNGTHGISLSNSADYNTISDNVISDTTGTGYYGINIPADIDGTYLEGNDIYGNYTGEINNLGAGTVIQSRGDFDIVSSSGSTQTALSVTQNGTGDIVDIKDGTTSVFKISDGGDIVMTGRTFEQTAVNPVLKGSLIDTTYLDGAYSVYISGQYAYVTGYNSSSLVIVDISKPTSPTIVGYLTDYTKMLTAVSVYVSGKYAYVTGSSSDSLAIVDISNPAAPTLAGSLIDATNLNGADSVYVSGKYAYVASFESDSLAIVDISNPAAPILAGSLIDSTNMNYARSVYIADEYAYIVGSDSNSLAIVDISNPAAPALAGSLIDATNLYYANSVYVSGKYAYVAGRYGDSLAIVDISNPAAPALAGSLIDATNLNGASSVYVSGKYAYVGGYEGNSLAIVDISNPTAPALAGSLIDAVNMGAINSVYVSGKYAYVAGFSSDSLAILDISGFDIPTANIGDLNVSTIDIIDNANVGNNLYVGNGLNVGLGGIYSAGPISAYANSSSSALTINQSGDGILVDVMDSGISIFKVGQATVDVTRPLDLQVEGDVGIEYNLNFLNNATSYIGSYGPLTISAGDSNSYENLTLTTSGTGDVIVDIASSSIGFKVVGMSGKIFSIDPNGNVIIGGADANDSDLTVKRNISTQGGNLTLNSLATPSGVTVTAMGTTGTTTYGYRVSAINGNGETLASSTVEITTGNSTLSASALNRITWTAVTGATGYKIYGRTSGDERYMATVNVPTLYYSDNGSATPSGALPTSNTTGGKINYPASDGPVRSLILTPSGATISAVNGAAQVKVDGTNHSYYVLDFDDTTDEGAYWHWTMPDSYDGGKIDVTYYWETAATTGDAIWCFQSVGIKPNNAEDIDSNLNSAICETDTAQANAGDLASVTETMATSGFEAGDYVAFKVYRNADDSLDTLTGDARLVKVKVEYHVNSESD